jgi:hypothetical protein
VDFTGCPNFHVLVVGAFFLVRQGHVRLLGSPDVVEEDSELASDCHDSLVLGLLACAFSQVKSQSPKRRVSYAGLRMWLSHSISMILQDSRKSFLVAKRQA